MLGATARLWTTGTPDGARISSAVLVSLSTVHVTSVCSVSFFLIKNVGMHAQHACTRACVQVRGIEGERARAGKAPARASLRSRAGACMAPGQQQVRRARTDSRRATGEGPAVRRSLPRVLAVAVRVGADQTIAMLSRTTLRRRPVLRATCPRRRTDRRRCR